MKQFLMMLTLAFLFNACTQKEKVAVECNELKTALIDENSEELNTEINALTADLPPTSTANDAIGHEENLNTLIDRLNECDQLTASLICYACIETFPVQSEIKVKVTVSGTPIERIIDISTPDDSVLKSLGMH